MIAIDLHTHSTASPDGGLKPEQYQAMLTSGTLQVIAVTDHDTIAMAQELHSQFGDQIIVGEEISSSEGDIIGLYLTEVVPPGLSPQETAERIHAQGGLVYLPHPFERLRPGVGASFLEALKDTLDIIEGYNGRSLSLQANSRAAQWATDHGIPMATSSDAHGWRGWGKSHTRIDAVPTRATLTQLLCTAQFINRRPGVRGRLYPNANRLRKRLRTESVS